MSEIARTWSMETHKRVDRNLIDTCQLFNVSGTSVCQGRACLDNCAHFHTEIEITIQASLSSHSVLKPPGIAEIDACVFLSRPGWLAMRPLKR